MKEAVEYYLKHRQYGETTWTVACKFGVDEIKLQEAIVASGAV